MTGKISTAEAIEWLAEQRRRPDRQSSKTVLYGEHLLQSGSTSKLGDDLWSFLEQLCLAALDLGKWELADLCISRLGARFPDSPRVASVQGMYMEAKGEPGKALEFYNQILKEDESDMIISKRRIAVLRSMPSNGLERAAEALVKHLDIFVNDVEGWQELASIYCELGLFDKAVFAVEEMILLFPSNSFFVLQLAEILYTAKDIARAYKTYLQVLEVTDPDDDGDSSGQQGPLLRALWGLKMCTTRILADSSLGTKGECTAENVPQVDALVTDLLLNKGYKGEGEGIKITRAAARHVLSTAA